MLRRRDPRWREWGWFLLAAAIPSIVLGVVAFRALRNEEAALGRELQLQTQRAADRIAQRLAGDLALLPSPPPWADAVVVPPSALDRPAAPPAPSATCKEAGGALAKGGGEAWLEAARTIVAECDLLRGNGGRLLWPVAALDPRLAAPAERLDTWIGKHAPALRLLEREALRREIAAASWLDDPARRRLDEALALDSTQASRALVAPQHRAMRAGRTPLRWSDARSRGWLERDASGHYRGYVVHPGSVERAVAQGWPELEGGLEARVLSRRGEAFPLQARVALFNDTMALVIGHPRPEAVARRSQGLLAAAAGLSFLLALGLAALLFSRMRRARQLSALRTDFVAAVSHELRTPIASLRMLSELLAEDRVEEEERPEIHQALAQEARRLGDTVDRLLGFSRMEAGKAKMQRERVDLAAIAAEAIERFEARHPGAPEITRRLAPTRAAADPAALRMAIDNLLENALKYAPEGGPYEVSCGPEEGEAVISVGDRGPGIAPTDQRRIFRPFERVDDRLSEATEGSGIGLSLVRHVAESHGGQALVQSARGEGATFFIRLPADDPEARS